MPQITWSPEAFEQLDDILRFYDERNASTAYGDRLFEKLMQRLESVQKGLRTGEMTGTARVRFVFVDCTMAFFEETAAGIEVIHVRDARRDPETSPF